VKVDLRLLRARIETNIASGDMVTAAIDELERLRQFRDAMLRSFAVWGGHGLSKEIIALVHEEQERRAK
jgi:hypothetical protein